MPRARGVTRRDRGTRGCTRALWTATVLLPLDWRAFHRTKRTEDTAVAGFRTKQDLAVFALVEELAGVHRHLLTLRVAAVWACQHGLENNCAVRVLSFRHRCVLPISQPFPPHRLCAGDRRSHSDTPTNEASPAYNNSAVHHRPKKSSMAASTIVGPIMPIYPRCH